MSWRYRSRVSSASTTARRVHASAGVKAPTILPAKRRDNASISSDLGERVGLGDVGMEAAGLHQSRALGEGCG